MKIDISELPGNSNMEKAQHIREARECKTEPEIVKTKRPVVKGHVERRRTVHLSDVFIAQDILDVITNTGKNVVVPRLRQLLYEIVNNAARGIFLGEPVAEFSLTQSRRRDYNSISSPKTYAAPNRIDVSASASNGAFYSDDVKFDDYGQARIALDILDEIMEDSGVVTISDLYGTVDDRTAPFTGNYYGWTDISSAKIKTDGNRYWIKLPRPRQLKD